jgi:hypothetical protein
MDLILVDADPARAQATPQISADAGCEQLNRDEPGYCEDPERRDRDVGGRPRRDRHDSRCRRRALAAQEIELTRQLRQRLWPPRTRRRRRFRALPVSSRPFKIASEGAANVALDMRNLLGNEASERSGVSDREER